MDVQHYFDDDDVLSGIRFEKNSMGIRGVEAEVCIQVIFKLLAMV
jgi:hypothetical protein